ncbi:orotate phosphoribosyltransferase [Virgibacillus xinjiangensis]|uniref:Orotate phosphoribosyltransferase n=1 Tax=Virgibacillus xinjiangensis TaxID=393090 RepID=A0ABV7CUY2_9BACI
MKDNLARDLLEIKAVQINKDHYFTWTSGIKSPIYCDNRLTMSHPKVRKNITEAFVSLVEKMEEKPEIIAGCATAGIPHAAWLADRLALPMVYVRSKPKGHGKGNQVEGELPAGKRVLVIEDLISTGGSSLQAAEAVRREGGVVTGVAAIFTYGLEKADTVFQEAGINFSTITGFDQLLEALTDDGELNEEDKRELLLWRDQLD